MNDIIFNTDTNECKFSKGEVMAQEADTHGMFRVMALYPGDFIDSQGTEVKITNKTVQTIADVYNDDVKFKLSNMWNRDKALDVNTYEYAPAQLDHDMSVRNTVGRVKGKMITKDIGGVTHLFMDIQLKRDSDIENVKLGLWKYVSIRFNMETHKFTEVSFVVEPAVEGAGLLSKGIDNTSVLLNKPSSLSDIRLSMNLLKGEIKLKELEIEKINFENKVANKVKSLVKLGKIIPANSRKIKNDLLLMSSPKDVDIAIRVLSNIPEQVLLGTYNRNAQAISLEELMMADQKGKTVEERIAILKQRATTPGDSIFKSDDVKSTSQNIDQPQPQVQLGANHGDLERIREQLKLGKYAEAENELSALLGEKVDDDPQLSDEEKQLLKKKKKEKEEMDGKLAKLESEFEAKLSKLDNELNAKLSKVEENTNAILETVLGDKK